MSRYKQSTIWPKIIFRLEITLRNDKNKNLLINKMVAC